ncbi:hypothetical protein NKI48_02925 [Mesorhizobium sp. M0644]|uniref:hypothetical protein n=1 Tax=Mesorhizobium sp. M0644 TaxID=2956979 RepID=UPI00333A8A83
MKIRQIFTDLANLPAIIWNSAGTTFTALRVSVTDTASASGSLLFDFLVGGVSQASLTKAGRLTVNQLYITNAGFLNLNASLTALLVGEAANTIGMRNGVSAQIFRVYNTFTSAANYERLSISWASNVCTIKAEAQTGTVRPLQIKYTPQTVATLPAAATAGAGARMFVSDALTPVFGSPVTGGGAVPVPVFSDGTVWNVG